MTITEALELNLKVRRRIWGGGIWLLFEGFKSNLDFTLEDLLAKDWEPYSPEPEKCEYCKRSDKIDSYLSNDLDEIICKVNRMYAEHLRKDHCQCKKEAP